MANRIPQTLPAASYAAHRTAIEQAIAEVLHNGQFILGRQTAAFEQEFAEFLGTKYCIGVGSGTDALELALRACGIGVGDAVLTVSWTAVATVSAIERCGASPVLVDIEPRTYTMDPNHLLDTIKDYQHQHATTGFAKLKAIIPVHLYGHPANLEEILKIALQYDLRVIEDCAQAHGAVLDGKLIGNWGDLAAFSFYPTKNLGALGDAGAVVTANPDLGNKVRLLREYGWQPRFISTIAGVNSRLDEFQAAILRVKLKHLIMENERRRALASAYEVILAGSPVIPPHVNESAQHVFHQYVIETPGRNALQKFLTGKGILTQIHYPRPVHLQPAYDGRLFIRRHGLSHTESAAQRVLSLPMSPYLDKSDVDAIYAALRDWVTQPTRREPAF